LHSKVTVVVGRPIAIPHNPNPTPEEVHVVYEIYLKSLVDMFERHKLAAGEPCTRRLVLVNGDGSAYQFQSSADWARPLSRSSSFSALSEGVDETWADVSSDEEESVVSDSDNSEFEEGDDGVEEDDGDEDAR
jgi:hypothetical protein